MMDTGAKAIRTCSICGRAFALLADDLYVARDNKELGLQAVVKSGEVSLYDAYDCPHCGCQNIIQKRLRIADPDEMGYNIEMSFETDAEGKDDEKQH